GDGHTVAIDNVDTIVIPKRLTIHIKAIQPKIDTLIVGLYPAGRIAKRDPLHQHIAAITKIDQHGANIGFRPAIPEKVFDQSCMIAVGDIESQLSSLTVDNPLALDGDIVLVIGEDQRS